MTILEADQSHLEQIVSLNRLFHLDIPGFKWDTSEWIEQEIDDQNYFILKKNGLVSGAICLKLYEEGADIETIAVLKDKQKSGIGRKLIEFAKEYSLKKGKSELRVDTFCEYRLEEFYEKCGFTKSPETGSYCGKPSYSFAINL